MSEVQFYGRWASQCGYCKKPQSSLEKCRSSSGMDAETLTPLDYQELLDRGWRRSGTHCYKTHNMDTCCPNFTISCTAPKFRLSSRSMRRCIRRLNAYLSTGHLSLSKSNPTNLHQLAVVQDQKTKQAKTFEQIKASNKARHRRFVKACLKYKQKNNVELDVAMTQVRLKWLTLSLRRGNLDPVSLSLEESLYPVIPNDTPPLKHKLTIDLVHVESSKSKETRDEQLKVMQDYQLKIHGEDADEWDMSRYCGFLVESPLTLELMKGFSHVESSAKQNDLKVVQVVLERASSQDNPRHLVDPPPLPTCYGTYHCCYRLDDKLIAVGVLDILPKCISAVYFFYDPQYAFLELGTYSALTEIALVRRLANTFVKTSAVERCPLIYYYLGLYVHKCPKMSYKVTFKPSYLLCDETGEYVETEKALAKLAPGVDYAVFSDNVSSQIEEPTLSEILQIPIVSPLHRGESLELTHLEDYWEWANENLNKRLTDILLRAFLIPYARLVGASLSRRMILRISSVHDQLVNLAKRNQPNV